MLECLNKQEDNLNMSIRQMKLKKNPIHNINITKKM